MPTRIFDFRKPLDLYPALVWGALPRQVLYPSRTISIDLNAFLPNWFSVALGVITVKDDSDPLPAGITLNDGVMSGNVLESVTPGELGIVFLATIGGAEVESGEMEMIITGQPLWTDERGEALWTDENSIPLWTR